MVKTVIVVFEIIRHRKKPTIPSRNQVDVLTKSPITRAFASKIVRTPVTSMSLYEFQKGRTIMDTRFSLKVQLAKPITTNHIMNLMKKDIRIVVPGSTAVFVMDGIQPVTINRTPKPERPSARKMFDNGLSLGTPAQYKNGTIKYLSMRADGRPFLSTRAPSL